MNRRSFLSLAITALVAPLALFKREAPTAVVQEDFKLVTFSIAEPSKAADELTRRRLTHYVSSVMRRHAPLLFNADIQTELSQEVGGDVVQRRIAFDAKVSDDLACLRTIPCVKMVACITFTFGWNRVEAGANIHWHNSDTITMVLVTVKGNQVTTEISDTKRRRLPGGDFPRA